MANSSQLNYLARMTDPPEADGDSLGTSSLEFSDIYLADGAVIYLGLDQDVTLTHTADTGIHLNGGMRLGFRDQGGEYIYSVSDGNLGIAAATSIDLISPIVDIGTSTTTDVTINFLGATNSMALQFDESANKLSFDTSVLVIDGASNRVGIGTASPAYELDISGTINATAIRLGGTALTFSAAEINVIDGDTSATATTIADADRVVLNDDGTMVQAAVTDLDTYFSATTKTLTNKTLTSAVLNTGISGTAIKDEDNMTSDSATHLATQQSIKAYVDSSIRTEEQIEDFVGGMFTGNTETLITATYEDSDGTIDLVVNNNLASYDNSSSGFITATLTQEQVEDFAGAMFSGNTETLITATYDDSDGTIDLVVDNDLSNYDNSSSGFITATLTQEQVEDYSGAMFSGNTETLITATYDDGTGKINLVVDNDLSNYDNSSSAFLTSAITQEQVEDYAGAMFSGNTETLIAATYNDGTGKINLIVDNDLSNYDNSSSGFVSATLTQEQVEDYAGAMFSGNTETLIAATYNDGTGKINLVVDNDLSNYDNSSSGFINSSPSSLSVSGDLTVDTSVLFVDSSGNKVGMGTTSPEGILHTADNSGVNIFQRSNNSASYGTNFYIRKSRGTVGSEADVSSGDMIGQMSFSAYYGDFDNQSASISSKVEGTLAADTTPGNLIFSTTAAGANTVTERMRIDSSGSIGIGTDAPEQTLHVSTPNDGEGIKAENSSTGAAFEAKYVAGTGYGYQLKLDDNNNVTTIFLRSYGNSYLNTGGNLGIGTSTPEASAKLELSSTTQGFLPPRLTDTQRDAVTSPATGLIIYNTTSGTINFYNGTAWRAVSHTAV